MSEPTLKIGIGDWIEEAHRAEVEFHNEDEMLADHVCEGRSPLQTGRMAIALRHLGMADDDVLPENKLLLNAGAAYAVSQAFAHRRRKTTVEGKEYAVREYVGSVPDDDEDDGVVVERSIVTSLSPEGAARARRYLARSVPGYIWGRLVLIAEQDADEVREAADALKASIDEMVARLTA